MDKIKMIRLYNVEPIPAGENLRLGIQGLTALVYGPHDPDGFAIRGWGDPSPESQAAMRAMFPRMVAHLHERF